MNILQTIILGVVEGVTEFLPISSTAHLMITSKLLGIDQGNVVKSFEIIIQLGAVCAVFFLYIKQIVRNPKILLRITASFIPTAIIGWLLYAFIKTNLIGNNWVMFWALILGGIILIATEIYENRKSTEGVPSDIPDTRESGADHQPDSQSKEYVSFLQAVGIGIAQAIAVIPGMSRSATTIIAGRLFGLSKKNALEFSFLLSMPTIAAAAGYDALKNISLFTENVDTLLVGLVVSFITALITIKFLLSFVRKHSFISFGIYRIVLAVFVLVFVL